MTGKSYFKNKIGAGIALLCVGVLYGAGNDAWNLIKTNFLHPSLIIPSTTMPQIITYILVGFGIVLLIWALVDKKMKSSKVTTVPRTRENILDDLIKELENFIKKWHKRTGLGQGYRKQILNK